MKLKDIMKHIEPKLKDPMDKSALRSILEAIIMTDAEMIFGGVVDENKSPLAEMVRMSDEKISQLLKKKR